MFFCSTFEGGSGFSLICCTDVDIMMSALSHILCHIAIVKLLTIDSDSKVVLHYSEEFCIKYASESFATQVQLVLTKI